MCFGQFSHSNTDILFFINGEAVEFFLGIWNFCFPALKVRFLLQFLPNYSLVLFQLSLRAFFHLSNTAGRVNFWDTFHLKRAVDTKTTFTISTCRMSWRRYHVCYAFIFKLDGVLFSIFLAWFCVYLMHVGCFISHFSWELFSCEKYRNELVNVLVKA